MTIRIFAAMLLAAAITSGCASLRYPLPSCDGGARRALNAGLWSYEKRSDLGDAASRLACG